MSKNCFWPSLLINKSQRFLKNSRTSNMHQPYPYFMFLDIFSFHKQQTKVLPASFFSPRLSSSIYFWYSWRRIKDGDKRTISAWRMIMFAELIVSSADWSKIWSATIEMKSILLDRNAHDKALTHCLWRNKLQVLCWCSSRYSQLFIRDTYNCVAQIRNQNLHLYQRLEPYTA